MLRVLYLLNHAGKAGTEKYLYSLVEKLNKNKIEAYFAYNEDGLLVKRLEDIGVKTYRLEMKHPFDFKAVRNLVKLCNELNIDIIHTQFLRENYIALLSKAINHKIKVIYTSHFIMKNNLIQKLTNKILTMLESKVIAVCTKGKEQLVDNWINEDKIDIVFNGVDFEEWGVCTESTLRDELGVSKEAIVLFCSSRFVDGKGHYFLIKALEELKKISRSNFKCVLANDGPLQDEIKKLIFSKSLEDDVIFLGFRSDIKNLLYGSDVYIGPSEYEALSFALIEALACGIPVVASDIPGNRDIVNENLRCGILVEYDNEKELANAINRLITDRDLMDEMKKEAKRVAKDIFGLDVMLDKTYNIYREVYQTKEKKEE